MSEPAPTRRRSPPLREWRAAAIAALRARGALAVFAAGLVAIAVALVVVLSQPGLRRAGYNFVAIQAQIGTLPAGYTGCQPELLDAGTRGVVVHASPIGAGRVSIRVRIGGAGAYDGTGAPGGLVATGVAAPLAHGAAPPKLAGTGFSVTMCVINTGQVALALFGSPTGGDRMVVSAPGAPATTTYGRVRIDNLLSAQPTSLWGSLPYLPDRITAATGSELAQWLVGFGAIVALLAAIALMRSRAEARVRLDVALIVALTLGTGALWAGLTPAFQKTDEPAHFEYVEAVANLGHPPQLIGDLVDVPGQLSCWLTNLRAEAYRFYQTERPPWTVGSLAGWDAACDGLGDSFNGAMYQGTQPPGYYYLAAAAYEVSSAAPLPTRLLFVRMFSVLLAALAVLCTYLLVREVIPGSRWSARAAACALALQPIFMFNESGVNADALVVAVAAAIALVTARAWRRGLSTRYALALGALTGVGVWSKLNFLTLVPSVALVGGALLWREVRAGPLRARLEGAGRLAAGALLAVGIYGLYILLNNDVWNRGGAGTGASIAASTASNGNGGLRRLGDFIWQFFLPRLPGRPRLFGYYPLWHDVLDAVTTRLGWWNDYGLTGWSAPLVVLGFAIAALAAVYIVPRARRRPWPALVALGALALFLVALVAADFRALSAIGDGFEGRYVFPAMPLWGLLVGCAVAAVPRRFAPALTGLLAALFVGHTVLAIASTTSVYYL